MIFLLYSFDIYIFTLFQDLTNQKKANTRTLVLYHSFSQMKDHTSHTSLVITDTKTGDSRCFTVIEKLPSNPHTCVCLALSQSGDMVVIKSNKFEEATPDMQVEITHTKMACKDATAALHILFSGYDKAGKLYMVLPYLKNGNLHSVLERKSRLNEVEVKTIVGGLLREVASYHKNGLVHRDIKLENILVAENGEYVICDFGLACVISKGAHMKETVGTPNYIPPEVLEGNYTNLCDVWSLGIVMYTLLSGVHPFDEFTKRKIFERIKKVKYSFHDSVWKNVSDEAKDLLMLMITREDGRLSANACLQHPWFRADSDDSITTETFSDNEEESNVWSNLSSDEEEPSVNDDHVAQHDVPVPVKAWLPLFPSNLHDNFTQWGVYVTLGAFTFLTYYFI